MEFFELRSACNSLLIYLNNVTGKSNIIKLNLDVQLPNTYYGNPTVLIDSIKVISLFLAKHLINGFVNIELSQQAMVGDKVILHINISGIGSSRTPFNQKDINEFINSHDINLNYEVDSNMIRFNFLYELINESHLISQNSLPFNGKNILLAEDNEINAMVFIAFLEEWGVNCTLAVNGLETVKKLQTHSFDLILMDIHMPIVNGISATKEIRLFNSEIPIIAMTASTREEDIRDALNAGMSTYLLKPVSSSDLFQLLSKYL